MKSLIFALAAFASAAVFAGADDILITFSTPGPDKYADGTIVLDDECYALCWSKTEFAGFQANGEPINADDKIVLAAPVAKGGKCPKIAFQIDAAYAAANFKGGKYSVWMLDTRKAPGDASAGVYGVKDGKAVAVRAATATDTAITAGAMAPTTAAAKSETKIAAGASAPVPAPVIKGIKIVDGNVYVTVANTVPFVQYAVDAGATPDATKADGAAQYPEANGEVTIVKPVKAGGEFFKAAAK